MAKINFDANTVKPQQDRSAVPEGQYKVILQSSEIKETDKKGKLINLGFKILEGPLTGQMVFNNINYINANEMAQRIGQERLSALCHATGVLKLDDTAQLHGRPLQIKVIVQADDARYNDITAFLKEDGSPIVASGVAAAPAPAAAPAWAQAAAPTPAPAPAAPAPVAAPVPAPAPAPAPVDNTQYFVASGGANLPGTFTADAVRALPQGLANVQVCPVGGNAWQPGTTLAAPAPVAAPVPAPAPAAPAAGGAALPPWMTQPPPPSA